MSQGDTGTGKLHFAERSSALLRYGVALLAVVLVVVLKLLLVPLVEQDGPFLLFLVAVMVGAWFGGLGPGLLATVASVLATDYFFLPPFNSFSGLDMHLVPLGLFVLEGVLVSVVITGLRSSRNRAASSALEAREHREDLRGSEERFRLLVEGVTDYAIIVLDPKGRVASWNAGAERIKGYREEEIMGEHFSRFYAEEDVERGHPEENLRIAVTEGRYEEEGWRVRKDGSRFWARVLVTALKDEEGNLRGFSKVTQDVTEKRETDEVLRASLKELEYLKFAIDESAIVAFTDQRGRITYVNNKFCEISKYSKEELLGQDHRIINSGYHPKEYIRNLWRTIAQGHVWHGELRNRAKDGSIYWVDTTIVPFLNERGKPYRYVAIRHDITERKLAEQRLQETLGRLLALYEGGQLLGSSLEREEIGSGLLETMRRISGFSVAAIELQDDRGQSDVLRVAGPEDLWRRARSTEEATAARCDALESGERHSVELCSSGTAVGEPDLVGLYLPLRVREHVIGVVEVYGPPELVERETVETLAGLAYQAASALENARLYEELAERERRLHELVGRILKAQEEERRRVAYEIHDGLAQIAVAAHQHLQGFAKRHAPENARGREELQEALELIQQAVKEARHVISNLRPTTLDDFGLATALRLQATELSAAEELQVSYEEALGGERLPAEVETTLFRVAQEALTNARKHAQSPRVRVRIERLDGNVRLEVRDWGRGFEVSEATNGGGPGERVGLPGMRERVALLGGEIEIESQPGAGTSVVAKVPLSEEVEHDW